MRVTIVALYVDDSGEVYVYVGAISGTMTQIQRDRCAEAHHAVIPPKEGYGAEEEPPRQMFFREVEMFENGVVPPELFNIDDVSYPIAEET
jgi:hypothetical protein